MLNVIRFQLDTHARVRYTRCPHIAFTASALSKRYFNHFKCVFSLQGSFTYSSKRTLSNLYLVLCFKTTLLELYIYIYCKWNKAKKKKKTLWRGPLGVSFGTPNLWVSLGLVGWVFFGVWRPGQSSLLCSSSHPQWILWFGDNVANWFLFIYFFSPFTLMPRANIIWFPLQTYPQHGDSQLHQMANVSR